jgi:hypothetical protein
MKNNVFELEFLPVNRMTYDLDGYKLMFYCPKSNYYEIYMLDKRKKISEKIEFFEVRGYTHYAVLPIKEALQNL